MSLSFPPGYELVPVAVLRARHQRLGRMCRRLGLDGLLLTHSADTYYASGTGQQGVVLVDADGGARVFMRRNAARAAAESPLPVEPVSGLSRPAQAVLEHLEAGARLGLTLDVMGVNTWRGWQKRLAGLELVDASAELLKLKAVKDAWELALMARVGRLAAELYDLAAGLMAPGVNELWLAGQLMARALERGSIPLINSRGESFVYSWHLVSGPEGATRSVIDAPFGGYGLSPAFPQGPCDKPLRPGEPIIVDLGVSLQGYQTDQTRTYCLGPAPAEVRRAHDCLLAVQAAIYDHLRPGAISGDIFDLAVAVATEHGMADGFLGTAEQRISFVGHGVGFELGAPPYLLRGSREVVRAGETYALELKIVLEQGPVGLENTVAVSEQGPPSVLSVIEDRLFEL